MNPKIAAREAYLKAMGIDIWKFRPVVSVEAQVAVEDVMEKEETGPAPEAPRFSLAFLHYETVGLCLSLDPDEEEIPRRFCDDIARSMDGNLDGARFQKLDWPMVKTAAFDQSIGAAREVVAEKLNIMPPVVFMFGEDLKEYFAPLSHQDVGSVTNIEGRTVALFERSREVMTSAARKASLWRVVSDLRAS